MELQDVTAHFEPARETFKFEGTCRRVVAPGAAAWSRKQIDELVEAGKAAGARGVYTVKVAAEGITSGLEKNLGAEWVEKACGSGGREAGRLDCGRGGRRM